MSLIKIAWDKNSLTYGSIWLLNKNINGYENINSNILATEAISGRKFQIINLPHPRSCPLSEEKVKVRLLEDGYICYFKLKDILGHIESTKHSTPKSLTKIQIKQKLPKILLWVEKSSRRPNHYLWGGTKGPDFDCSGLIQTAFSSEQIWLPRDAYQQEKFCTRIEFNLETLEQIFPGDLLFFGDKGRCTHVGLYKGKGAYWHSSGSENGRDGIGIDYLNYQKNNAISAHYFSMLRGAGRVEYCHNDQLFFY